MTDDERNIHLKFLQDLKVKKKEYPAFEKSLNLLQKYAASKGLVDDDIDNLANVIMNTDLGAMKLVSLVKCLVPVHKVPEHTVKSILSWYLSSINKLPFTVSVIIIQWIVGILDYQLIDKKVVNIYYHVFFHLMLKKDRLEKHITRLIYVLTKPEDVTRRNVSRLLALHQKYSRSQKHIIVLLSLFKSYKPELVPEKIQSINTKSVWPPIPEILQLMLQDAQARSDNQQTQDLNLKYFNWTICEPKKTTAPLLPSVGYFQIGSSIFKEKNTNSIFDVSSTEELGKLHLNIELPCNAVSLLANTAGFHLLTFANFQYQSRFSYNLYNTLIRAFILENEKFSAEEINKLLDMTIEFSRYMQQDILIVNRFLDEYLYYNTGEYQSKLLTLLQWITSVSINDLQEKILVHIQNIFYESNLSTKCEIIKMLKMLITNWFISQGFEDCCHKTSAPFLGQDAMDNLEEVIPILTKFSESLIVSGLNIYLYDILFLSEALSFYEEVCTLESRSNVLSFTLAPSAVIHAGFVTKHCAILSRICKLLLRYHNRSLQLKNHKTHKLLKKQINNYVEDIVAALLSDKPFKKKSNIYFLQNILNKVKKDLEHCTTDCLLSISNHYAVLPYKYVLIKTGLNISTKEDAISVALHYYPIISEFLDVFKHKLKR